MLRSENRILINLWKCKRFILLKDRWRNIPTKIGKDKHYVCFFKVANNRFNRTHPRKRSAMVVSNSRKHCCSCNL